MTSMTLSSLCLDRTKCHWTSIISLFQPQTRLLLHEDLSQPSSLSKWVWGDDSIWYLSHVNRLRITLEALSFTWEPLPPWPRRTACWAQQDCQFILNTSHSPFTNQLTPHPPASWSHPPTQPLSLHYNEDEGGGVRARRNRGASGKGKKNKNWREFRESDDLADGPNRAQPVDNPELS